MLCANCKKEMVSKGIKVPVVNDYGFGSLYFCCEECIKIYKHRRVLNK